MALSEAINQDIKEAMRAREKDKLEALRAIKAALLLEATKGSDKEISAEAEMKILMRLHKQRKDSAEIYTQQGREELAAEERFQAEIIEAYLPAQMSEEEIRAEVSKIIESTGASGMKDMGKVMGQANQSMAGKADGKTIAAVVKSMLQ